MSDSDAEMFGEIPDLPRRAADAHKNDFGRVLVVAGSRGMSGAAVLCGSAALRGGAGLVTVATPEPVLPLVAAGNPCYLTYPLPADEHGHIAAGTNPAVLNAADRRSGVARRPGLGP